jgi:CBS domain-containing protein
LISRRYQKTPLYQALLEQDDIHLPGSVSQGGGRSWFARDIMGRDPVFIAEPSSIQDVADELARAGLYCGLVGSAERLEGLVLREVVDEAIAAGQGTMPVKTVLNTDWPFVYPDHPLELTLERFRRGYGVLPVLSRTGVRRVEGVITHQTVMTFLGQNPSAARVVEKSDTEEPADD